MTNALDSHVREFGIISRLQLLVDSFQNSYYFSVNSVFNV